MIELSERELEVLRLIAEGESNLGLGYKLEITEYTVKNHVRHILHKTGAQSRAQAVAIGFREGLLE